MKKGRLVALCVAMLWAALTSAQTTGRLEGVCIAPDDLGLPGVTVEISSPSMQGTRVDVTDAEGHFRFPAIPPGDYQLTAALDGFTIARQEQVHVGLDRQVALKVSMKPAAFEGEIEVTSESPVIDVSSPEVGTNFGSEALASMPLDRDFTAVLQVLGGVQYEDDTTEGFAIYGSTGAENSYVIQLCHRRCRHHRDRARPPRQDHQHGVRRRGAGQDRRLRRRVGPGHRRRGQRDHEVGR
jgi:hypothetical protein